MKFLSTVLIASVLSVGTVYANEEVKKQPETKRVCVDIQGKDGKPIIDQKTKKPKQDCKEVKVRKKFEGTKVPEKK